MPRKPSRPGTPAAESKADDVIEQDDDIVTTLAEASTVDAVLCEYCTADVVDGVCTNCSKTVAA